MEHVGFKGILNGIQGIGVGAGHGICGKGEFDKNNTEGKEWIWRHELELDGKHLEKATGGDGGFSRRRRMTGRAWC